MHNFNNYTQWNPFPDSGIPPEKIAAAYPPQDPRTMALYTGGGLVDPTSRRNIGKSIPESKTIHTAYQYDAHADIWYWTEIVNGVSRKQKAITKRFYVVSHLEGIDPISGKPNSHLVGYFTDREHRAIIPDDEFHNGKFHKHMREISVFPHTPNCQINDLIGWQISTVPSQQLFLYPHPGFIRSIDGRLEFVANQPDQQIPDEILHPSIKKRTVLMPPMDSNAFLSEWASLYGSHPKLMLLGLLAVSSILLYFFEQAENYPNFLFMVRPSDTVTTSHLKAMLCLHDTQTCPIPNLECRTSKIQHYLSNIYDGTALFCDDSLADENAKIDEAIRFLVRASMNVANSNQWGRNIIMMISRYAAGITRRITEGNIWTLSMDDVALHANPGYLSYLTKGMESLIIRTAISHPSETQAFFNRVSQQMSELTLACANASERILSFWKFFHITAQYMEEFLHMNTLLAPEAWQQIADLLNKEDLTVEADQMVIRDFSAVLSNRLRTGDITAVQKRQRTKIDPEAPIVVVDGNRVFISGDTLDHITEAMPIQMRHNRQGCINALRQHKLLHTTDGNTSPIQVYDLNGTSVRLYWYCIDISILEEDVVHQLENLDCEAYWQTADEMPRYDYITLLNNGYGKYAGFQVRYQDVENRHCYVCGQSGAGKTHLLSQMIAKNHEIGHRVVIFNSSDSFTAEALCRNLSPQYVNCNFVLHDIDSSGIPINLFGIDRDATLPMQKKELLNVLKAGTGELTPTQSNKLRSAFSDMLTIIGKDELIRTRHILTMLAEQGATYESLRTRLEPLFDDIDACGMSQQSWGAYLKDKAAKIIIIRTASGMMEQGNQVIDMLLATLIKYQQENPDVPLDIFIDEVQNQNCSAGSPIFKIMTEGRKYHLSFYGATQDYYPRSTDLGKVMGKAGIQIFLCPTQNSAKLVADELRFHKAEAERFDTMQRGNAIVKGSFYDRHLKRNIPTILNGKIDSYIPNTSANDD
ncbi:MAG: hypothetical protein E7503_04630 [Ruminococcus sp.]|nr:hypothetical protein [Ruminococcus sp.]